MNISEGDKKIITQKLMPYFGQKAILLQWSDSKKKWPDLWCRGNTITVTREWTRQSQAERMKRIVHELAHISWGMEHRKIGKLDFNTIPDKDTYSKMLYQRIANG